MKFYLGTHAPDWLSRSHVPLFVSAVRLRARCKVKLPRARVPWALDSGGFSVLTAHGGYPATNREYAAEVRRWHDEVGHLDWAAVQDWMCEPHMIERTGLSVAEHQRRTVESYRELRQVEPHLPWVPVLQGYTRDDYFRCLDLYDRAGFDLRALPVVGIGSVCRRQATAGAERIIRELAGQGLHLHGFGFKLEGLERCRDVLASADSLAWSFGGRKDTRAERKRLVQLASSPSLFDTGDTLVAAAPSRANSASAALDWLEGVRVRAGILPEVGLLVCPFCESLDVCPPISSELDHGCVECGSSWGDVRLPALR